MDGNSFGAGCFVGCLCMFFLILVIDPFTTGQEKIKKEALLQGYAYYKADEDGKPEFTWIDPTTLQENK